MTIKLKSFFAFAGALIIISYLILLSGDPSLFEDSHRHPISIARQHPAQSRPSGADGAADHNQEVVGLPVESPVHTNNKRDRLPYESVDFNYSSSAELLQASMDDYFDIRIGKLAEAYDANVELIRASFNTEQVCEIDAGLSDLLRDNSISREQKLASLFQVIKENGEWSPKKGYLLDTLSELRPIELTSHLVKEYEQCLADECRAAYVSILSKSAQVIALGESYLSSGQLAFVQKNWGQIESFLTVEVTERLAKNELEQALLVLNNDSAVLSPQVITEILEPVMQDAKTQGDALAPYLAAVVGTVPINMDLLDRALAMVKAEKNPSKNDILLGTIESALKTIPMEQAQRAKMQDFIAQERSAALRQ